MHCWRKCRTALHRSVVEEQRTGVAANTLPLYRSVTVSDTAPGNKVRDMLTPTIGE